MNQTSWNNWFWIIISSAIALLIEGIIFIRVNGSIWWNVGAFINIAIVVLIIINLFRGSGSSGKAPKW
jgi:uncharacterized membrane protein (DUF2068 family)